MDTDDVTFPALIVAEDGWVDYLDSAAGLSAWTTRAIKKYNQCRVLLYDRTDRAWLVESIVPQDGRSPFVKLVDAVRNAKLAVRIRVRPIRESPIGAVREALLLAIGEDDDILTQDTEAPELKAAIQKATSFKAVVEVLRAAGAI